jgi:carbamoyl-phosphate synthase large subunit
MEHIERAGIHSGDSMAVYPPQTLNAEVIRELEETSCKLARALKVRGVLNIQFIISKDNEVYVLEVNPRASRTIPFLSKVTGVPMVHLGTVVCMGKKLRDLDYRTGIIPEAPLVAVKAPVFSFSRLNELDIDLGPQMKSTGEIMGVDRHLGQALYKALLASGIDVPHQDGNLLITVADRDKDEAVEIVRGFLELGYNVWATTGTADRLEQEGINAIRLVKISEGSPNPLTTIQQGACDLLINTLSANRKVEEEGAMIRKASVERGIPCFTSLDTARAMLFVLRRLKEKDMDLQVHSLKEILGQPAAED